MQDHSNGSFDYRVMDPRIKRILASRSLTGNVVQIGTPFVKLTSMVEIPEYIGEGNMGFTLGVHASPDMPYEDVFSSVNGTDPLLGYTYTKDGTTEKVYAKQITGNTILEQYFSAGLELQNLPKDAPFTRIPPPGITNVKVGRNTQASTLLADVDILVPSLAQLEYLNRIFMVPSMGMVLEWGQRFALEQTPDGSQEDKDKFFRDKLFPWYDREKLNSLVTLLARNQYPISQMIENYVYPNNGQYMWMFGRVGNFTTKGNADGSFNVTIKLVGSSEEPQYVYATRNTISPSRGPQNLPCVAGSNSIEEYLTKTTPGGYNLKTLLDGVLSGKIKELSAWKGHVIQIKDGNKKAGAGGTKSTPNANQTSFADVSNAYYMSWRFFVNVVLNYVPTGDGVGGIRGLYKKSTMPPEVIDKLNPLRPLGDEKNLSSPGAYPLTDKYENYVGSNPYLRSFDPGTMVIVNEFASEEAKLLLVSSSRESKELVRQFEANKKLTQQFLNLGGPNKFDFHNSVAEDSTKPVREKDRGLLSTGVWLNHKTVVTSLLSGQTLFQGISNLLNKMNYATRNYWALTLDPLDAPDTKNDYIVVDRKYRKSSQEVADAWLNETDTNIYTFNKALRKIPNRPGDLSENVVVGSEITDFNITLDLPKLLFAQIATLGFGRQEDYQDAQATASYDGCANPTLAGSSETETLRQMFGILSISPKGKKDSIDVTARYTFPRPGTCTSTSVNTLPAGAGGAGRQPTKPEPRSNDPFVRNLQIQRDNHKKFLANDDVNFCVTCKPCFSKQANPNYNKPPQNPPLPNVGAEDPMQKLTMDIGSLKGYKNGEVPTDKWSEVLGQVSVPATGKVKSQITGDVYNGRVLLEKEAAAQLQKLVNYANSQATAPGWTINSAYVHLRNPRPTGSSDVGVFGDSKQSPEDSLAATGQAIRPNEVKVESAGVILVVDGEDTTVQGTKITATAYRLDFGRATVAARALLDIEKKKLNLSRTARETSEGRSGVPSFTSQQIEEPNRTFYSATYQATYLPPDEANAPAAGPPPPAPGTSPHGMGLAIDIAELLAAANNGATDNDTNSRVRETNALYKWLKKNGPAFGWYNPIRLASTGAQESWHWEYWGYIEKPTNIPPEEPNVTPTNDEECNRALLVAGKKVKDLTYTEQQAGRLVANQVGRRKIQNAPQSSTLRKSGTRVRALATPITDDVLTAEGITICKEAEIACNNQAQALAQVEKKLATQVTVSQATAATRREFPNLNAVLKYIEILPDDMMSRIRCTSDGNRANSTGVAPATLNIKVDMTLPGIAGLRIGELFWVDRIPAYYKIFGAFQILNIEDTVGIDGWQTKITAAFNSLGSRWKQFMLNPETRQRIFGEQSE